MNQPKQQTVYCVRCLERVATRWTKNRMAPELLPAKHDDPKRCVEILKRNLALAAQDLQRRQATLDRLAKLLREAQQAASLQGGPPPDSVRLTSGIILPGGAPAATPSSGPRTG